MDMEGWMVQKAHLKRVDRVCKLYVKNNMGGRLSLIIAKAIDKLLLPTTLVN